MSKAPAVSLILLSLIWLFYAIPLKRAAKMSSVSNAMALESELKGWAEQNTSAEAVQEIFDENNSLKLGGESKDKNFREMIADISESAAVPAWPGVIGFIIGIMSVINLRNSPNSSKDRQTSSRRDTLKS